MKKYAIPCVLALTLLLTACGGRAPQAEESPEEAVKDHYYQILDAEGRELYTVTEEAAVAEIDALISDAGGASARHGSTVTEPLYTYVYWQAATRQAGETEESEPEYLELFRTCVGAEGSAVTTEVLSVTLENVGEMIQVKSLDDLLTFSAQVSPETADALRNPAQFADRVDV